MKRLLTFLPILLLASRLSAAVSPSVGALLDTNGTLASPLTAKLTVTLDTFADFETAPRLTNATYVLRGYHTIGGGGGGEFVWDSTSTASTNLGTVIKPSDVALGGRFLRQVTGPVEPKMFGAKVNGLDDDTVACQAALDNGLLVYFPGTTASYLVSSSLRGRTGQQIFGDQLQTTTIRYAGSNMNCLSFSGATNVFVSDLIFVGSGIYVDGGFSTNNCGIMFTGCTNAIVQRCSWRDVAGAGVRLHNSDDCTVQNCWSGGGLAQPLGTVASTGLEDVGIDGGCRNKIIDNVFLAELDHGIGVITASYCSTNVADNLIARNTIRNKRGYGIIVYNNLGAITGTVISENHIENITGTYHHAGFPAVHSAGGGMYIIGAENTRVCNNTVTRCGLYTDEPSVGPAAIGFNLCSFASVSGNSIYDTYQSGIYVQNNPPNTNGIIDITGNSFRNVGLTTTNTYQHAGVYVVGANGERIHCTGNSFTANYPYAVYAASTNAILCSGNVFNAMPTATAIMLTYGASLLASGNVFSDCAYGIQPFTDSSTVTASENVFRRCGVGIVGSDLTSAWGNTFYDCLNGAYAAAGASPLFYDNRLSGNTVDYSGPSLFHTLADTAYPSVANTRYAYTGGTNTITSFLNGEKGQLLTIIAQHNVTIQSGHGIALANGDYAMTNNMVLELICDASQNWTEVGRSASDRLSANLGWTQPQARLHVGQNSPSGAGMTEPPGLLIDNDPAGIWFTYDSVAGSTNITVSSTNGLFPTMRVQLVEGTGTVKQTNDFADFITSLSGTTIGFSNAPQHTLVGTSIRNLAGTNTTCNTTSGDTNVVLASVTGFSVGNYVYITRGGRLSYNDLQTNVYALVDATHISLDGPVGTSWTNQTGWGKSDIIGLTAGVTLVGPGTSYAWIQAQNPNESSTNSALSLQPIGGNLGVGLTNPVVKLDVDGYAAVHGTRFWLGGAVSNANVTMMEDFGSELDFLTGNGGDFRTLVGGFIQSQKDFMAGVVHGGTFTNFIGASGGTNYFLTVIGGIVPANGVTHTP